MSATIMIDILSLIQQHAPIQLDGRPSNSRDGKEYHSNCPWCGGTNRFAIWPEQGRYSCSIRASGCGKSGDQIQFLRDYCDMTYAQACQELDIDPRYPEEWKPVLLPLSMTSTDEPCAKWQDAAEAFCWRAQKYLWTPGAESALNYLHSRGFTNQTLKLARIGFCPGWYSESLEAWGLAPEQVVLNRQEAGDIAAMMATFQYPQTDRSPIQALLEDDPIVSENKPEIKIPRGIVLPWFVNGRIWKISVRREDKSYFQVLGSSDALYGIDDLQPGMAVCLVEGEFDKLSVQQEAGDIIVPIATGSASKGRTSPLVARLKKASHILIAFDTDEAGHNGFADWLKMFPNAMRWRPWAHDANEMLQQNKPIRLWVEMGIKAAQIELAPPETLVESTTVQAVVSITNTTPALEKPSDLAVVRTQTYLEANPWTITGDRGLPRFCSVCKRNQAVWWGAGVTPYCDKCWTGQRH